MNERRQDSDLARYLAPADVWAIAFGCIVGWDAFIMPGTTLLPAAGPAGTVLAMAVSALKTVAQTAAAGGGQRHQP